VAVRLLRHVQAALGRLRAHRGLVVAAQREHRVRELVGVQHTEDVGLVLAGVGGAVQLTAAGPVDEPRVVAGGDGVEAERARLVQHRRELDLLVATQARVRGAARPVLGDEVVDDVLVEPLARSQM